MTTFWEIAAQSVNHMSHLYYVYLQFFVASDFGSEGGTLVLIVPVPGHCLPFTLDGNLLFHV